MSNTRRLEVCLLRLFFLGPSLLLNMQIVNIVVIIPLSVAIIIVVVLLLLMYHSQMII